MDKKLISLVKAEAKLLKVFATKKQIKKLDIKTLNPKGTQECIYGQMTGNCFNEESVSLIELCCKKVYHSKEKVEIRDSLLNGSPLKSSRVHYWSPIEVFIDYFSNKHNGNNDKLVAYLKGETKTLKFAAF